MGRSKKKTRAKQRQERKAAEAAASATAEDPFAGVEEEEDFRSFLYQPGDDLYPVIEHLQSEQKMNSRCLLKNLPKLCRDLQEQTVPANKITHVIIASFMMRYTVVFFEVPTIVLAKRLAEIALQFAPNLKKKVLPVVWYRFVDDIHRAIVVPSNKPGILPRLETKKLHLALDLVLSQWAKFFDEKLNGGEMGFLQQCPLYGKSNKELMRLEHLILDETESGRAYILIFKLMRSVLVATTEVADGSYIKALCWECGKDVPEPQLVCSQCLAACYCGKECQKMAWKTGHTQKCTLLKIKHKRFLEAMDVIEDAHNSGALEDMGVSKVCGYGLLPFLFGKEPSTYFPDYSVPSMDIFYVNYHHVMSGDWWIYDQPGVKKAPNPSASDLENLDHKAKEMVEFQCISLLLSHKDVPHPVEVCRRLSIIPALTNSTSRMTAERFIQIYQDLHPLYVNDVDDNGPVWRKYRCQLVKVTTSLLRGCSHK